MKYLYNIFRNRMYKMERQGEWKIGKSIFLPDLDTSIIVSDSKYNNRTIPSPCMFGWWNNRTDFNSDRKGKRAKNISDISNIVKYTELKKDTIYRINFHGLYTYLHEVTNIVGNTVAYRFKPIDPDWDRRDITLPIVQTVTDKELKKEMIAWIK